MDRVQKVSAKFETVRIKKTVSKNNSNWKISLNIRIHTSIC